MQCQQHRSLTRVPRVRASALPLACARGTAFAGATLDRIRDRPHRASPIYPTRGRSPSAAPAARRGLRRRRCASRSPTRVKSQLGSPQLSVDWVPVTLDNAIGTVRSGKADLLCTPVERHAGAAQDGVVLDADLRRRRSARWCAPMRPQRCATRLEATTPRNATVWRGSPALNVLEKTTLRHGRGHDLREVARGPRSRASSSTPHGRAVPDYAAASSSCWSARSTCSSASATWCWPPWIDSARERSSWSSTASSRTSRWRWRCRAATRTSACWWIRALSLGLHLAANSPRCTASTSARSMSRRATSSPG